MPRMRLIVLLREPAARALSEFENKKADKKLYRYIKQRYGSIPYKGLDNSSKHVVPTWYQLVSASASAFQRCTPATLFTFYDTPEFMRQYRHCYVNPFVLGSAYSRYLRPWVDLFGEAKQLLILDQVRPPPPSQPSACAIFASSRPSYPGVDLRDDVFAFSVSHIG